HALGDARRADHAAGPADILDDHLLAEDFGEPRGIDARQRIDRPPSGIGDHHGDRPRRPVLRTRIPGEGCEHRKRGRDDGPRHAHLLLLENSRARFNSIESVQYSARPRGGGDPGTTNSTVYSPWHWLPAFAFAGTSGRGCSSPAWRHRPCFYCGGFIPLAWSIFIG